MDEKIELLAKDLKLIKELQASDIYTANYQEAMALFSLGYRKAEEVRKEMAEKFAEKLKEKIDNQQYILLPTATVKYMIDESAKEIISEYGMEVEE